MIGFSFDFRCFLPATYWQYDMHDDRLNKTDSFTGSWCTHTHLAEVAGHSNIVPGVVVELPTGRLHQGLEGTGAQVDDQPQSSVPQGQVNIVSWPPRVKQQAVPLHGAEGQRDLIQTALNGSLGQVVAEELIAFEGGHWLLLPWEGRRNILDNSSSHYVWFIFSTVLYIHCCSDMLRLKWAENVQ